MLSSSRDHTLTFLVMLHISMIRLLLSRDVGHGCDIWAHTSHTILVKSHTTGFDDDDISFAFGTLFKKRLDRPRGK